VAFVAATAAAAPRSRPTTRQPPSEEVEMRARLLPRDVLVFLGAFAGAAFLIGLLGAILRHDDAGTVFLSAVEAAVLAFVGGLVARSFISLLLWTARDSDNVSFLLGWAFFLWPGVIDTVPKLVGKKQYATRPIVLLWIATSVGAFTGMMDGMWQTHDWVGPGVVAFALDETWGLAGTTQGDLLHVVNFTWGDHVTNERRSDAHRYQKGFAVKSGFAFTQGAVMSSNQAPIGSPLFSHENTHVWQNRLFGPVFILSYIVWLILFLLPGLVYGAVSSTVSVGQAIERFSYLSNPWEAWAYAVQGVDRPATFGQGVFPDVLVVVLSLVFFPLFLAGSGWIVYRTWSSSRGPQVSAAGG
jgi:hypothetical protein